MRQPNHMCRGDNFCYQIREIVDDPDLQWQLLARDLREGRLAERQEVGGGAIMTIQPGTFKRLPDKHVILTQIEEERRHLHDLSSYMWYIMPVAERFGEQVYEVAAELSL